MSAVRWLSRAEMRSGSAIVTKCVTWRRDDTGKHRCRWATDAHLSRLILFIGALVLAQSTPVRGKSNE
jgi:hypothetical protein